MTSLHAGLSILLTATLSFVLLGVGHAQKNSKMTRGKNFAAAFQAMKPGVRRDLDGNWLGEDSTPSFRNFASNDNKIPEPPLSEWGKRNLLMKSISHDALAGKRIPGSEKPGKVCPDNHDPCYSEDQNGVPANDPNGEYPGKDCEPLAVPAMYDYPYLGAMELVTTPEGDRIFQFFEYHREWRTFWLNREHPKDLMPSYEGHSIAHWEDNTLVVDTIGFNGKTMITQNVGHWKSDAFRLVERFRRVDNTHLEIEMTYYDSKAWGPKPWPGFIKKYKAVPKEEFQEFICSPLEYKQYDQGITETLNKN